LFGIEGIWGISVLAFVAAITSTNPGVYLSLANTYGDSSDEAVFPLLAFMSQPLIPLLILSFSEGASVDFSSIISLLLPFFTGFVMGNISVKIRSMFANATSIILPFWGISVGSKINILKAFQSFESGLILVLLFFLISLIPLVIADKMINKSSGFMPAATCTVAAVCLIVPELASNINANYMPYVESSQNQLATAVVITSIVTPLLAKKLLNTKIVAIK
jgi:2-keto-3-deoxygluconate permease